MYADIIYTRLYVSAKQEAYVNKYLPVRNSRTEFEFLKQSNRTYKHTSIHDNSERWVWKERKSSAKKNRERDKQLGNKF